MEETDPGLALLPDPDDPRFLEIIEERCSCCYFKDECDGKGLGLMDVGYAIICQRCGD